MDKTLRFLVVDEDAPMRRIIKDLLQDVGYVHIEEADDGKAALPTLKSSKFDIVVIDWNMSSMPGLDLLKAIRADDNLHGLPVLMVTAEAKREQVLAAAQAGVSGYVVRPFTREVLKLKLEKILQVRGMVVR